MCVCLQLCTGTIWDRTLQQLHVLHSQGTLLEETSEATDTAHSKQLAQVYQVHLWRSWPPGLSLLRSFPIVHATKLHGADQ